MDSTSYILREQNFFWMNNETIEDFKKPWWVKRNLYHFSQGPSRNFKLVKEYNLDFNGIVYFVLFFM